MKPMEGEIVKGVDTSGKPFTESTVVKNNASDSVIRKPNGLPVVAEHKNIKGQLDQ